MKQSTHLALALLLAIRNECPIAIQQLLQKMYLTLDFEQSKRLLIRLLPLMTPQNRDYFKSLSL